MEVLGDRPFPLKESIKQYLEELQKRKEEESEHAYQPDAEEVQDAAEADHTATADDDKAKSEEGDDGGVGVDGDKEQSKEEKKKDE